MLLSLVINSDSQRLLVEAVAWPGTELAKCFRGKNELVYELLTAILHPHPSLERKRAGVCAKCWLLCTRGDTKVSCAKSIVILWGDNGVGCVFSNC